MIHLIYGPNNYQARQILQHLTSDFANKNAIEKYDSEALTLDQLPDVLRGASLFAPSKMVVLYQASSNKLIWDKIGEYLPNLPDELELVLFEDNLDQRTKTYKLLRGSATLHHCQPLSPGQAIQWLEAEAKELSLKLSLSQLEMILARAGQDQWQLWFALEKLSLLQKIDNEAITSVIEPSLEANVFDLIDAALGGNKNKVRTLVTGSIHTQEPLLFFGLLASQLFQLTTLVAAKKPYSAVAKDLTVHPYPLQKVSSLAGRLSTADNKKIVQIMIKCDDQLKRSGASPWDIIEVALLKLASLKA